MKSESASQENPIDTILGTSSHTNRPKVRIPVAVKLVLTIFLLVATSTIGITLLTSFFFSQDSLARIDENNFTYSRILAGQIEDSFRSYHSNVLGFFEGTQQGKEIPTPQEQVNFFIRNPQIAYFNIISRQEIYNTLFLAGKGIAPQIFTNFIEAQQDNFTKALAGNIFVINSSASLGFPSLALFASYKTEKENLPLVIIMRTESIINLVQSTGFSKNQLLTLDGEVLIDSTAVNVVAPVDKSKDAFVAKVISDPSENLQFPYTGSDGKDYIGAFQKIKFGSIVIATSTPTEIIYKASNAIIIRDLYLMVIMLAIAMILTWFIARSLSRPILKLSDAAGMIEAGKFDVKLKATTHDELGLLTYSFNAMAAGLAEREHIKENFGRFVNKEVVKLALQNQLVLGGVSKTATIFFSDIRSFTAISETMSPEAVVEFLNAYMTCMVDCVEQTGGIVDKFIGDAIMAVWGIPISKGSPRDDARGAIQAMLLMREALVDFNKEHEGKFPRIAFGCGVNTGPVLAGQIGSQKRMEYTVIGDSVNVASRVEGLTKAFHVDLLITEESYNLLKDEIIAAAMPPIKVKGKTEPMTVYALINMKNAQTGPRTLDELRAQLNLVEPDSAVVSKLVFGDAEVKHENLAN